MIAALRRPRRFDKCFKAFRTEQLSNRLLRGESEMNHEAEGIWRPTGTSAAKLTRARSADFRPDINGLRSIAVAAVVLFHFEIPGFRGGFVGVDVFFVISGFLMTKIIVEKLWAGRFRVFDFYLARAKRIFPALAVLCLVLLTLGAVSLSPVEYQRVAWWSASSLVFLSNFTFLNETGYFDTASAEKWLLHTWSLSVEWQFYLLFPLLLMIAWRALPKRLVTVVAIAAAFVLSLAISIIWSPRHVDAAYFLLPTRAWEMMGGALVYVATPYLQPKRGASTALELAGLALILFAVLAFRSTDPWPGYRALCPIVGAMLVIIARNTRSIVTTNPVADFIGTSSYSIYLWHWPVATALTLRGLTEDWRWAAAGIGVALLLGQLSYRWIEVPTRNRRVAKSSEWLCYGAAASLLVACSIAIFYSAGIPARLGSDENLYEATAAAASDWTQPGCRRLGSLRYCEKRGTTDRLVMFVGDSIAEQWYPRYAAAATAGPTLVFVTRPGCPPIRNVDGFPPNVHCGQNAAAIWDTVRRLDPQELVISSEWWQGYFLPSGEPRRETCFVSASGCRPITAYSELKQIAAALQADILEATKRGTAVVILGPPPYSDLNYVDLRLGELASKHLPLAFVKTWQTLPGEERQSVKKELATLVDARSETPEFLYERNKDTPQREMEKLLRDVAVHSGARFVPLEAFMCPHNRCPLTDRSGVPIYADHLHLRAHYVESASLSWLDGVVGIKG